MGTPIGSYADGTPTPDSGVDPLGIPAERMRADGERIVRAAS